MSVRTDPQRPWALTPPPAAPAVGDELRRMFDSMTSDPMPQRLVDLCDALEEAFRRGDLYAPSGCKKTA